MMEIRKPYTTRKVTKKCKGGRTEQHHKKSCCVNQIMERFLKTKTIEHRNVHRGQYGFCTGETYADAMMIVAHANSLFEELPAQVRNKFNHEPGKFLDFVQNPENAQEMVDLGLATKIEDIPSLTEQIVTAYAKITETEESKDNSTVGAS